MAFQGVDGGLFLCPEIGPECTSACEVVSILFYQAFADFEVFFLGRGDGGEEALLVDVSFLGEYMDFVTSIERVERENVFQFTIYMRLSFCQVCDVWHIILRIDNLDDLHSA